MAAGPTPSFEAHAQCFVLFDPAGEPARLYRHPLEHLLAQDEAHAATLPHWIEQQLGRGHELALFAGFGAADALALVDVRRTCTPGSILSLGIPVLSLDGEAATPSCWAGICGARS